MPLPDYLFAFCPWLIAHPHGPAAWYRAGQESHSATIQAVKEAKNFIRQFSWE